MSAEVLILRGLAEAAQEARVTLENKKTAARISNRCLSARCFTDVKKLLSHHNDLVVKQEKMDSAPWLIGTPYVTLDLKTSMVGASNPQDLITRSTLCAPQDMPTPIWDRFLNETAGGSKELQGYLQRLCGYALTGKASEQMAAFFWGSGGNGKS